jgi:hypothetical protein
MPTQRGQTIAGRRVDERDDRLEAGASAADNDCGPECRQRDGASGELLFGLEPAPQMRRQLRRIVAEAAQVDELLEPGPRGLFGDSPRRLAIAPLEVTRAERVHEVVGDVNPFERPADGFGVARVGPQPRHTVCLLFTSRPRHDVMRARQSG